MAEVGEMRSGHEGLGLGSRSFPRELSLRSTRSPLVTPHLPPIPPFLSSTMGIFSKLVKTTVAGSIASVGVFWGATRNDIFETMDSSDPIFQSAFFKKFNPSNNPTLHDVCVRRIPLDKIQPSLIEEKGKLVEAFCAGVWGGMGKSYPKETSLVTMQHTLTSFSPQDIFPSEPFLNESTVAPRLPTTSGTDPISSRTNTK